MNPSLPLENLCSRLDNYVPKNDSQEDLLRYAMALVNVDVTGRAAGIFISGEPGVGKTHVAVGITKELMNMGQEAYYLDASNIDYELIKKQGPDQAWVLDDLNKPHGQGMHIFKGFGIKCTQSRRENVCYK